jgi:hypothetical protein
MKNIYLIQTDKPSKLHLGNSGLVLCDLNFGKNTINGQHIYITNDEEIKENVYALINGVLCKTETREGKIVSRQLRGGGTMDICKSEYLKIILTTDQDLIKDGVQTIDDEFLEWFVKNPSCEFVEVEESSYQKKLKKPIYKGLGVYRYDETIYFLKIMIPKEEPKQESVETDKTNWKVVYEDSLNMQKCSNAGYESKIQELKQEIERMYSEKEVLELIWKYETRKTSMVGYGNVKKWFEQFKKK